MRGSDALCSARVNSRRVAWSSRRTYGEALLALAPTNLHVLQEYRKPKRVAHPLYEAGNEGPAVEKPGRLRLCPYYFVVGGQARLSGALATFCPPDKKIIHGMVDAALLPCRVFSLT